MLTLKRETSERSKNLNKAEALVNSFKSLKQISFEGVSIKEQSVKALFDRACLINGSLFNEAYDDIINSIKNIEPYFELKIKVAKKMKIKWYFVVYEYNTKNSIVIDTLENKIIGKYNNFLELGKWISQFSDTVNLSSYQESGLPLIDTEMRSNNYSWPGNLDGLLVKDNRILCIIEYQNTSKTTVDKHDNNIFMKPTKNRKGDGRRWLVFKTIAESLNTRSIVIVWSYNENQIAIKSIKNYILDKYHNVERLVWGNKILCDVNKLNEEEFVNIIVGGNSSGQ